MASIRWYVVGTDFGTYLLISFHVIAVCFIFRTVGLRHSPQDAPRIKSLVQLAFNVVHYYSGYISYIIILTFLYRLIPDGNVFVIKSAGFSLVLIYAVLHWSMLTPSLTK